jgi:hypothetical protein
VGADEALTYFLSWYEKVDLENFRSVREGSVWTTDPEFVRRRKELAHSYVDYADTEAFVRDIHEPEKKDDAPTLRPSYGTSASRRRRTMLGTLKALTPARMKRKLRTLAMPAPKFRTRDLPRPEAMAPSPLLDPALLKPMSPLPQLHLPAALLPPLPLKLCIKNILSFIRSPVCWVQL